MLDSTTLSLGGVGGVTDTTTAAQSSFLDTQNQFLTLLTTQLQNQDPLNPMDSNQFTSQLVSMAGVEQQLAQSQKLDELIKLNQANTINSTMLSYVGSTVQYTGNQFSFAGGTQVQFDYTNSADAANTTINIYDKDNNLVWTGAGDATEGQHSIIWPGTDTNGKQVSPAAYRFEAVSKADDGSDVAVNVPVTNFNYSTSSQVTLNYNLASAASTTSINILDSSGNTVYTGQGETAAGDHTFLWQGTDSNGLPVPAGNYTVQIGAADPTGKSITTTTTVPAVVSGIAADNGGVELIIGNQKVPISSVTTVGIPG